MIKRIASYSRQATNDVAGIAIRAGQVVYQDYRAGGKAYPANAKDKSTCLVRGVALTDADANQQFNVCYTGQVDFGESCFQAGMVYVVSLDSGALMPITAAVPNQWIAVVGQALSETVLNINTAPPIKMGQAPEPVTPEPAKAKSSKRKASKSKPDSEDE